ncbi:MAG: phosphotransferase [Clostridiales bacterium]|nr:phosphotransferase [Clostridiales bacterium]
MKKRNGPHKDPSPQQLRLLARQWDIDAERITRAGRGWRFKSEWGEKLLVAAPVEEAVFGWHLQRHLHRRGFTRSLRYIPNKYGDPYAVWEQGAFFLLDWLPGEECKMERPFDMVFLASFLADFHNCAEGLFIGGGLTETPAPDGRLGELLESSPPPLCGREPEVFSRLLRKSEKALEKIPQGALRRLLKTAAKEGQVCHGKFHAPNIIEFCSEPFIVDLSAAGFGVPVWDLAFFLNRSFAEFGGGAAAARDALAAYELKRPLSTEEKEVLSVAAELPFGFFRIMERWQQGRIDCDDFREKLLLEAEYMDEKEEKEEKGWPFGRV